MRQCGSELVGPPPRIPERLATATASMLGPGRANARTPIDANSLPYGPEN